ncbi:capsular polysaccharide export protein [Aliiruegeria haliotis]|uniref:Capsular polysaccharide export protein n=1 Tax=Aliiruegeria haliotis TaxID=1280846 RepID=A0A2T0RY09_9RHOB|nr:capsular polysaccharide biosynthesis protein [Aliiruegeria haliotis]PRY26040.1 capsular polysaccharide export protein [Aliiruegeria haliotis]
MNDRSIDTAAVDSQPRRLFVFNGGFLNRRIRRILMLSGWQVTNGRPGPDDWVGVWGRSPTSGRGEQVAQKCGARILRIEDAFLRSIRTGRDGEAPIGLQLDRTGVHFDSATPSDLETLLASHPLDDTPLLDRARTAMARIRAIGLSKYNAFDPDLAPPAPGYVLVVDQTEGDASIRHGGASATSFREMLTAAQIDHPGARIILRTHPETAAGHRKGHFGREPLPEQVSLLEAPVSPHALLDGATAVYTVSSQMGFEAILAGHRPHVFGQPFYAGWGLTEDDRPVDRRHRHLTRAQLFAAAMILHPTWYDPWRDRLCALEDVIDGMEARVRAFREDRRGYTATGMRLWKRAPLRRFYGQGGGVRFASSNVAQSGRPVLAWASRIPEGLPEESTRAHVPLFRAEDGFLRSKGLGAELVPPMSLVADDLGIYYDPGHESRLEQLVGSSAGLPDWDIARAERLITRLTTARLSKYNIGSAQIPDLPTGHRILVPGQVEDDASIRLGCGEVRTNLALLDATRAANPTSVVIYKPHPDVEAGLRNGAVPAEQLAELADVVVRGCNPIPLIEAVDEVWTLTSLLGFEALLRGRQVTCLGMPFYAGWGLTRDHGAAPDRRMARPTLAGLVHAALIAYPRYHDPVTNTPCPVEVIVDRLEHGQVAGGGPANRALSKLQGVFASLAPLWR